VSAARLILIEGMIGAGKTTTAGWVEDWLSGRGEDARAFREFDEDQPIRTRAVDQLRGQPAFIDDAPADAVAQIFDTILGEVAPAEPLLVYLRPAGGADPDRGGHPPVTLRACGPAPASRRGSRWRHRRVRAAARTGPGSPAR
jgi:hypothetical protein